MACTPGDLARVRVIQDLKWILRGFQEDFINLNWNYRYYIPGDFFWQTAGLPLVFAVIAYPPDPWHRLEAGAAGTGGNLLAAALGALFRLGNRRRAVTDKLPIRTFVGHYLPPVPPNKLVASRGVASQ
jgi:hypothetical protein